MLSARLAGGVELREVGVEEVVAHELREAAVPRVPSRLDDGVDASAAGAPLGRIVGIGHHLEFLDRVHVRRHLERASEADGRSVEAEAVGTGLAAAHGETAVDVPAARARKARCAELLLREEHARRQFHHHIDLPSIEREFGGHQRIEVEAARCVGGLDQVQRPGRHCHLRGHLPDFHLEGQVDFLGHHRRHVLAAHFMKSARRHFDVVRTGLEVGQRVIAVLIGFPLDRLVRTPLDRFYLRPRDGSSALVRDLAVDCGAKVLAGRAENEQRQT